MKKIEKKKRENLLLAKKKNLCKTCKTLSRSLRKIYSLSSTAVVTY
jgi:RNase P subunit RPR2